MEDIANRFVKEGGPAIFEFATLRFDRRGSNLVISASYIPDQIVVPLALFLEQVERFEARLSKDMQEKYPDLARNEAFRGLFAV